MNNKAVSALCVVVLVALASNAHAINIGVRVTALHADKKTDILCVDPGETVEASEYHPWTHDFEFPRFRYTANHNLAMVTKEMDFIRGAWTWQHVKKVNQREARFRGLPDKGWFVDVELTQGVWSRSKSFFMPIKFTKLGVHTVTSDKLSPRCEKIDYGAIPSFTVEIFDMDNPDAKKVHTSTGVDVQVKFLKLYTEKNPELMPDRGSSLDKVELDFPRPVALQRGGVVDSKGYLADEMDKYNKGEDGYGYYGFRSGAKDTVTLKNVPVNDKGLPDVQVTLANDELFSNHYYFKNHDITKEGTQTVHLRTKDAGYTTKGFALEFEVKVTSKVQKGVSKDVTTTNNRKQQQQN